MTIYISFEEQFDAWDNWWKFWTQHLPDFKGHEDPLGGYAAYEAFLGVSPFGSPIGFVIEKGKGGYALEEEAARKIRMLCSPHWETILMAYCALRGINDDGNQPG